MVNRFSRIAVAAATFALALVPSAMAQDISLSSAGGADQIWKGVQPNANAGIWLDQGAVSNDTRRDLIVGAPGTGSLTGVVYVIFGGPTRTGEILLSSADTIITSAEAGSRFGAATAAGNIRNTEGTTPRSLVVGAPLSSSGRGAVYLFAGGFANNANLTTANAVYTILGASGDQLGSALATGDLDNDGYREIIIGAPGNNRVYIIKGGPALSGTLDLSTTAATQTIGAPGLGRIVSAGDVTGDGIYDVILGAPSANVAYLFAGSNGTIPSTAIGSFAGIDSGDEAAATIRILDIDADGKNDLAFGAPGGDGPANDRLNAGEVYVFLGPVGTGPRSFASANLVFFGAAAGHRAGDGLAAGDINRDTPNDLVIDSSGSSGGAGELTIYYGRSRSAIGAVQGDGRRFVDFASPGQASRRIFGDAAVGPITSTQVFEVTGEGARDIIVGVAGADSGAGKLYFTISPKLRISASTATLFVSQGSTVTSATPIAVTNASTVFIGWQTSSNVSWLSTTPVSGSADQTHPAAFNIVGSAAGLNAGTHTGRILVTSTSPDLEMSLSVDVTMTVTGAAMSLDSPVHGIEVNPSFTASGWAVDIASASGTGISEVQIYAYPNPGSGQTGTFLGTATYGGARSDVGTLYGARFTNSGFTFPVTGLTVGTTYQIAAFAKSTVNNQFVISRTAVVRVVSGTPNTTPPTTPPANPDPGPTPTLNPPASPGPTPGPDTRVSFNRTALYFGVIAGNNGLQTSAQQLGVLFANGGASWTISSNSTWLDVSPSSGAGAGIVNVSVKSGSYASGTVLSGVLTLTAPGVANSPITLPVTLRAVDSGRSPFGLIDTPLNNSTGVVGAIAVTGWAVDEIGITEVTLWRDPIGGESPSANGKVFLGRAVQVDGARPDVESTYAQPFNYKAGWGYMLLTNMLPNQGNGTFTLHAYAADIDGHSVLIGSRTITCDNANATKPFGTIDTPDQGGTVTGTSFTNFGWALTPQPNSIPIDGSTILVFIDGVPVGRPTYNQNRTDIATLFPGRANSNGAVGFFQFNPTTLANGVHTIAWSVSDSGGNAEGIGSRYFTVINGAALTSLTVERESSTLTLAGGGAEIREAATTGVDQGKSLAVVAALPAATVPVYRRTGFAPDAPLQIVDADDRGVSVVSVAEAGRVALTLGSPAYGDADGYDGYVVANGALAPLPVGAFLDRRTGEFFWHPGVGFTGRYELVFVRTGDGVRQRIAVDVQVGTPK